MSDDATRHDAAFSGPSPAGESVEEVDEILGEVIDGRYEIVSRIGSGGMGFVFQARHVQLNQELVVKTLRPELVSSSKSAERFTREAQAATRIRHPNVIDVKDFGVHPRFGAYYVMERLEGRDLEQLVQEVGPLPPARAVRILTQVASALAAAHAASIIHRDLKPANVFLVQSGQDSDFVKVLDFGLARVMDANRRLTETGQVIGTPRYMAPEQCAGERVDARADVFSAGLLLWEMLTGQRPYADLGTYEILGHKMLESMPSPRSLDPPVSLSEPLERLVMACLSKDPAWRPADGAELLGQLERLGAASESAAGGGASRVGARVEGPASFRPPPVAARAAPGQPRPTSAVRGGRGRWLALGLLAAAIAALGAVVGVGLLVWSRAPDDAPPPSVAPPPAAPVVSPAPPPGAAATRVVVVRSEPPGATVSVGPRVLGTTPLDVRVPDDVASGTAVRIALEGHTAREITIVEGVPTAHVRLHPTR